MFVCEIKAKKERIQIHNRIKDIVTVEALSSDERKKTGQCGREKPYAVKFIDIRVKIPRRSVQWSSGEASA